MKMIGDIAFLIVTAAGLLILPIRWA